MPGCFVPRQPQQLRAARVAHGFRRPGAGKPGYGKVLGVDRLAAADQPKRRLVRVAGPWPGSRCPFCGRRARRIRGTRGKDTIVDSQRAVLVWEPGKKVPVYAFPR